LFTAAKAAEFLRIAPIGLRRWLSSGRIAPARRTWTGKLLFHRADLVAALETQQMGEFTHRPPPELG
jgi:predicted site-specific integrase-resolvase